MATAQAGSPKPVEGGLMHYWEGDSHTAPELELKDHWFNVPLDYSNPEGRHIRLYVREVIPAGSAEKKLPYILYLQGGPGFESPRPTELGGWMKKASEQYRVLLLDQRGTGRSTPLTVANISALGGAQTQADYLQHFRADNIVKDAELIRSTLCKNRAKWAVLGQSFGGFCILTYLSQAPDGLDLVLLTGGLAPVGRGCTAETVYRATFKRVITQNRKYYQRFPKDEELVRRIVLHLAAQDGGGVSLPSGGKLTPRGLQTLGLGGLGSAGGFECLHYLLEKAWEVSLDGGKEESALSYAFLKGVESMGAFDTNPLYALLHEAIYCQGAASRWAAERVCNAEYGGQFDAIECAKKGHPVLFTGEMVFPWMFEEIAALQPLKEVADLLAEKDDWPALYDKDVLGQNQVPVAAAAYYEDIYVDFQLSEETAAIVKGLRLWVTSEYQHSGIREDGPRIFERLLQMATGKIPLN